MIVLKVAENEKEKNLWLSESEKPEWDCTFQVN